MGTTNPVIQTKNGKVGINQTDPQTKLHITNDSGGSGGYLKVTDAGYNGDVRFGMFDGVNNDALLGTWTNNNIYIYTNGSPRMRITNDGKVLVGTTTDFTSQALQVNGFIDQVSLTSAFRLYNGSSFVGGLGNGQWAYSATYLNDYAMYAVNNLLLSAGGTYPSFIIRSDTKEIGFGDGTYNAGLYAISNNQTRSIDSNWGFKIQRTSGVDDYNVRMQFYPDGNSARKLGLYNSRYNDWILYADGNTTANDCRVVIKDNLDVGGQISSQQTDTVEYGSITGTATSGGWYKIANVSDTNNSTFYIKTYAHSSMTFMASRGYHLSNQGHIQILDHVYGANGSFANASGVRIRQNGDIEIKLNWSSGPTVSIQVTVVGTRKATLESTLALSSSSSPINDTVETSGSYGMMRARGNMIVEDNLGVSRNPISGYKLDVNGNARIQTSVETSHIYGVSSELQLGNFTSNNSDEWPKLYWLRDTAANWDEGLIKGGSNRGVFGREHFGIHFDDDRSFGFHTSSWDTEMEIRGDGHIYQKGPVYIGRTSQGVAQAQFSVQGSGWYTSDSQSRVLYLDGGASNGNIIQFTRYGTNKWEVVGREGTFYIYKNDGTGSGYKWQIDSSGNHTITGVVTTTSTLRAQGDVIAYYSSDKRLKDNVTPIPNALDKINAISGYEFDWNDKQDTYEGHDVGVIAQEIEEILPEVVTTREDGYKAVKYGKIVPLLIQGIKEQQKQIEELKALINNK